MKEVANARSHEVRLARRIFRPRIGSRDGTGVRGATDEDTTDEDPGDEGTGPALEIRRALAVLPYDAGLYRDLYDLATQRMDGEDAQLHWGKWLHWRYDYSGDLSNAEEIGAGLSLIDVDWNRDREIVSDWRESVLAASEKATKSRSYRVAGHVLGKLLDLNPSDKELNKAYSKLYGKAGEGASGGAFTAERVRRHSPKWLADQDRKHAAWSDAFSRRTKHYKIITNISYSFFETVSVVMEEMFAFYQQIFDYRKSAPTVTLAVHRKRSDFDKYCIEELGRSYGLGTGGWFADWEMTVAAYDRTESGRELTDLYRVLFHESSHQFMYLITKKRTKQAPPTWLNEGTASYFEGCELQADGSIVKNKPALGRLREWESLESSDRSHSLKDLITVPHRGYDGSYYSYGWALVYFLNNFENEEGELVYREAYLAYLKSYTKKGAKEPKAQAKESLDRAVRFFVDEVGDPDVPDWDAFEARWRAFTRNVVLESKKGPEFAETLQKRCDRYLGAGDYERALIMAEQADDRRPGDIETYRLLSRASEGLGRDSDAAYWMLLRWELAWELQDDDAREHAEEWLRANDRDYLVESYCDANAAMLTNTLEAMEHVAGQGHPALALLFASHSLRALGIDHPRLLGQVAKIQESCREDLRLWQRAYTHDSSRNTNWGGIDVVRFERDGVLINNPEEFGRPVEVCEQQALANLEPPFDVRGQVTVEGDGSAYLLFGIGANGRAQAGISFQLDDAGIRVALERLDRAVDTEGDSYTSFRSAASQTVELSGAIPFEISVRLDGGQITIGEVRLPIPEGWEFERFEGRTALTTDEATIALFADIEIRPGRPFWPVVAKE